jgi:hypothetical protein
LTEEPLTAAEMLERLRALEAEAEQAYERMYGIRADVTARYSDAKEFLYEAITLARRLGLAREVERLSARLDHIKTVFRRQFPI